jgi:hypothetical protein
MSNYPDDGLGGDKLPAVKFETVGASVAGQILAGNTIPDKDYATGVVKVDDRGRERTIVVYEIDTDGDGRADQALFVRGHMFTALREAKAAASVPSLIGAHVKVTHHALGTPSKAGFNPPKLFEAKVKAGVLPQPDPLADEEPW